MNGTTSFIANIETKVGVVVMFLMALFIIWFIRAVKKDVEKRGIGK